MATYSHLREEGQDKPAAENEARRICTEPLNANHNVGPIVAGASIFVLAVLTLLDGLTSITITVVLTAATATAVLAVGILVAALVAYLFGVLIGSLFGRGAR